MIFDFLGGGEGRQSVLNLNHILTTHDLQPMSYLRSAKAVWEN